MNKNNINATTTKQQQQQQKSTTITITKHKQKNKQIGMHSGYKQSSFRFSIQSNSLETLRTRDIRTRFVSHISLIENSRLERAVF